MCGVLSEEYVSFIFWKTESWLPRGWLVRMTFGVSSFKGGFGLVFVDVVWLVS